MKFQGIRNIDELLKYASMKSFSYSLPDEEMYFENDRGEEITVKVTDILVQHDEPQLETKYNSEWAVECNIVGPDGKKYNERSFDFSKYGISQEDFEVKFDYKKVDLMEKAHKLYKDREEQEVAGEQEWGEKRRKERLEEGI